MKYTRKDYGIVRASENARHQTVLRELDKQYAKGLAEEDKRHLMNTLKIRKEWRETQHPQAKPKGSLP